MVTESLEVRSGGPGLRARLARAVGGDAPASVRRRQRAPDGVDAASGTFLGSFQSGSLTGQMLLLRPMMSSSAHA